MNTAVGVLLYVWTPEEGVWLPIVAVSMAMGAHWTMDPPPSDTAW